MNRKFAASALSIAIAAAMQSSAVLAENCVDKDSDGRSVNEWGVWCGVDQYLSQLNEENPSAAGEETGSSIPESAGDIARDSDQFDPELEGGGKDHIVLPVLPEDEYVGYFARYDWVSNGTCDAESCITGSDIGGFGLDLEDNGSNNTRTMEPTSADKVSYALFSPAGNVIGGEIYDENSSGYAGPVFNAESVDVYAENDGDQQYVEFYGYHYSYESGYGYGSGYGTSTYEQDLIRGETPTAYFSEEDEKRILQAYFVGVARQQTQSYDGEFSSYSGETLTYVAGKLTPQAFIQDLVSGNVQATYVGYTHFLEQPVSIDVNFGSKTFAADFGDAGSSVRDELGIPDDVDMGFAATGHINGRNLVSDTITAHEGTMTGVVQGSFFQPDASVVGGVYEVQKDGQEWVDAFTTVVGANSEVRLNVLDK